MSHAGKGVPRLVVVAFAVCAVSGAQGQASALLDTSIVILLGRIQDPATLPDESVISAVTLAELSVGPHVADTEAERIARQAHLQQAENDFDVIAFDAGAARAFGAVAGALRTAGRKRQPGLTMP
jgi:tRNA(fMet)-specific endonuclease VapC